MFSGSYFCDDCSHFTLLHTTAFSIQYTQYTIQVLFTIRKSGDRETVRQREEEEEREEERERN